MSRTKDEFRVPMPDPSTNQITEYRLTYDILVIGQPSVIGQGHPKNSEPPTKKKRKTKADVVEEIFYELELVSRILVMLYVSTYQR